MLETNTKISLFSGKTFRILLKSWLILKPRKHTFLASFEKKKLIWLARKK
jgi:hypothetical protein